MGLTGPIGSTWNDAWKRGMGSAIAARAGTAQAAAQPAMMNTIMGTGANQVDVAEEVGKQLKAAPITYKPKTLDSYMPENVQNAMSTNLSNLTNFKAEPVRLSSDYWNKTLQDTMQPMQKEYDRAREQMRGDLAAEGNIYDWEGHDSIRKAADDYLTNIGSVTRGVEISREKQAADDAKWAQEQNLAAAQAGGGLATDLGTLYGNVGSDENQFATTAALQDRAAKNSLLGGSLDWLTGKYGAEADVYAADRTAAVDTYKAEQDAIDKLRQRWIDYLNVPGYSDVEGSGDMMSQIGSSLVGGTLPKGGGAAVSTTGIEPGSDMARATIGMQIGKKPGDVVTGIDGKRYQMLPSGGWLRI